MATPTFAQLVDPTQGGNGLNPESYPQRLLTIASMIASGQNPDGTTNSLIGNITAQNGTTGIGANTPLPTNTTTTLTAPTVTQPGTYFISAQVIISGATTPGVATLSISFNIPTFAIASDLYIPDARPRSITAAGILVLGALGGQVRLQVITDTTLTGASALVQSTLNSLASGTLISWFRLN